MIIRMVDIGITGAICFNFHDEDLGPSSEVLKNKVEKFLLDALTEEYGTEFVLAVKVKADTGWGRAYEYQSSTPR